MFTKRMQNAVVGTEMRVLLRYGAAALGDWLQTFRRNTDEGKMFLQNVANRVTLTRPHVTEKRILKNGNRLVCTCDVYQKHRCQFELYRLQFTEVFKGKVHNYSLIKILPNVKCSVS